MSTVIYTSSINGQPLRNNMKVVLVPSEKMHNGMMSKNVIAQFKSGIFQTGDPKMIKLLDDFPRYGFEYCRQEELNMGKAAPAGPDQAYVSPDAREPEGAVLKEIGDRGKNAMEGGVVAPELPEIDPDKTAGMKTQVVPVNVPGAPNRKLESMNMGELNARCKELGISTQIREGRTKAVVIQEIEVAESQQVL